MRRRELCRFSSESATIISVGDSHILLCGGAVHILTPHLCGRAAHTTQPLQNRSCMTTSCVTACLPHLIIKWRHHENYLTSDKLSFICEIFALIESSNSSNHLFTYVYHSCIIFGWLLREEEIYATSWYDVICHKSDVVLRYHEIIPYRPPHWKILWIFRSCSSWIRLWYYVWTSYVSTACQLDIFDIQWLTSYTSVRLCRCRWSLISYNFSSTGVISSLNRSDTSRVSIFVMGIVPRRFWEKINIRCRHEDHTTVSWLCVARLHICGSAAETFSWDEL